MVSRTRSRTAAVPEEEWKKALEQFAFLRSFQDGIEAVKEIAKVWSGWALVHHDAAARMEADKATARGRLLLQLTQQVEGLSSLFISAWRPGGPILDCGDLETVMRPGHPWGRLGRVEAAKRLAEHHRRVAEQERINGLFEAVPAPARDMLLRYHSGVPEYEMEPSALRARARSFESAVERVLGMVEAMQAGRRAGRGDGGRFPHTAMTMLVRWADEHDVGPAELARRLVGVHQLPEELPEQLAIRQFRRVFEKAGWKPKGAIRLATEQVVWGRRYTLEAIDPLRAKPEDIETWRTRLTKYSRRDKAKRGQNR